MSDNFIPGVYNYCDRWCERCTFTARCRVYERTGKLAPEQLDVRNRAFWNELASSFAEAKEMVYKTAADLGIDLSMTEEEERSIMEKQDEVRTTARNHPMSALCKQYLKLVTPFAAQQEAYVENTRALIRDLRMGTRSEDDVVTTTATIGDCIDVIQWYVFFIDAKLQRALQGRIFEEESDGLFEEGDMPKDSDGSAKIAIIALERSINAWMKLYELMPATEDTALNALALLSKIKMLAVDEFPQAMQFVRPGFDE
ncbi:MAG: hypothetical protein ACO1OO_04460 [Flavisolibacter sp.]